MSVCIGIAMGGVGAPAPSGRRKKLGLIYTKNCKCIPQAEQESTLGHFFAGRGMWRVGGVYLVVLACVLRATTKKVVNFF